MTERGDEMEKKRFSEDANSQPLCKFGPGGDYTRVWPPQPIGEQAAMENPIGKLLATIGQIISATVTPEKISEITAGYAISGPNKINPYRERAKREPTTGNAKATESAKPGIGSGTKQLLFADDSRSGQRTRRKPNNRVRTHRRVAKKRADHQDDGQGTLFKDNCVSQPAA
jgi:hypothetical protein